MLPGVLICSKHQRWLFEVCLDGSRQRPLLIPGSTNGQGQRIGLSLTSNQADACVRVSQMSDYLLHNKLFVLPDLTDHFRKSARAVGFAHGPDFIRTPDLNQAVLEHFGEPFLRYVDALPESAQSWIKSFGQSEKALRGRLHWQVQLRLFVQIHRRS
jgi:hypothetical protein